MHSFLKLGGYNENSSLAVEFEVFEDLTKPTSDRYEFVYPNVKYQKNLNMIVFQDLLTYHPIFIKVNLALINILKAY